MKKIKLLLLFSLICVFGFIFGNFGLFFYAKITPKIDIKNANSVFLYDKDGNLFFQGNGKNEWISLNEMSEYIINATVSVEDKNFFHHKGFDYFRIIKSAYENIKAKKYVQGASTITQQYAKNLYLDFDKNWERKIEEAWLTIKMEINYSKEEILEGYLNTINYGNGVLGIENASKYYFDKSAKFLTLSEASMLAGIPKSPNNFSPLNDELEAKKRQYVILTSMVNNNYINEDEKNEAFNTKLTYIGKKEKYNLATLMYYQDAVMKELRDLKYIPESLIETKGLKIYTNLDINAQIILENSVNNNLKDNQDIQVASVMVEPTTGKIIALTGGRDYQKSQFNRATQSKRQVGSTMKPFLYYAALENGFTASTTFLSEPTTFTFSENKDYTPQNYAKLYPFQQIAMAAALSYSDNIYAVKTHLFLGEDVLVETMKRVGVKEELNILPSLPLGTGEINIIDYLTGYNTFANEGIKNDLYLINKIVDSKGSVLFKHKNNAEPVLDKNITYILNDLLTTTYDYNMIDYNSPTCLNIAPRIANKWAVKTGTTDYDGWAVGYNKNLLVGVWTGYDNNQKLDTGESTYAKKLWADVSETYVKDKEVSWYEMPENVIGVLVNPIDGTIANEKSKKKRILYYLKGTEPLVK
ncbi:MAG: PBP1A family penicillin-binding protein [Bacilli bacterium]|nr:PBP1A family penicillin-binding protein [Bacilli bacterium]MDD3305312.1 PBP1A family penicillin-binding protein [Bacilli bacterium]MDD4053316.1 PBP1A family penicillin-binding protein [Bacilli bacterium]MDD4411343.1 PBP1A family penicillin-binding protein [Bacilli bacterium]